MRYLYYTLALLSLPYFIWSVLRTQKLPCDESNRINKVRLIWFSCTRQNLFKGFKYDTVKDKINLVYKACSDEGKFVKIFPWLRNDEYENIKHVKGFKN